MLKGMGWRPDTPDRRDRVYTADVAPLPDTFSLRQSPFNFPAFDQKQIGSCTAQGVARICRYAILRNGQPDIFPSRLGLYALERNIEQTLAVDAGAEIRTGLKVVAADGLIPEESWGYTDDHIFVLPPNSLLHDAKQHKAIEYIRLKRDNDLYHLRHCIAQGWPITFGFTCYESLDSNETAQTGFIALPQSSESVVGGHCMVWDEYDHNKRTLSGYNSWGSEWGANGRFTMPYEYALDENLSDDMWTVRTIT